MWKQRQYDGPLTGKWASHGRARQPCVCALSLWMTLYLTSGRWVVLLFLPFDLEPFVPFSTTAEPSATADPGGPVDIILPSGSEVRGFDPCRGR